jgi:spermidine/putrescine transport system substrate-binding protein
MGALAGKSLFMAGLISLSSLLLGGCGGKADELYIYNWITYTPETVIEKFQKEYQVKVIYAEFDSNEAMYAKLLAGGTGYDIVFPSETTFPS